MLLSIPFKLFNFFKNFCVSSETIIGFYQNDNKVFITNTLDSNQIIEFLQYLDAHSEIDELVTTGNVDDKLLIALGNTHNSTNLTIFTLCNCEDITYLGLQHLPSNLKSLTLFECVAITTTGLQHLPSGLTSLNVSYCTQITDTGLQHLPSGLTSLNILGCTGITPAIVEMLVAEYHESVLYTDFHMFYKAVEKIQVDKYGPNFNIDETVKTMVFNIARFDTLGSTIKFILNNPDKYPFLVNSKDTNGHDLMHFYTHNPEMQKFLFELGAVPTKKEETNDILHNIINDSQSVHVPVVTKCIAFFTKELVNKFDADFATITQAAEGYAHEVMDLFTTKPDITIPLLDLTAQEKGGVMITNLDNNAMPPTDQQFIQKVTTKVLQVLNEEYLRQNAEGDAYDRGYSTAPIQYDYTKGAEKTITIPQSIGLIAKLITLTKPDLEQMKELAATLITKRPELIAKADFRTCVGNKAAAHEYLQTFNADTIKEFFKEVSGLEIEEVYREQQKFKLAKQLYIAATTYGENSSACIQGTWAQIIATSTEIDSRLNDKWGKYQEAERAKEAAQNSITKKNIMPFLEQCVNEMFIKKDGAVLTNQELKEPLLDLATAILDIVNPEKITKEEQQLLSSINAYFSQHIKNYLLNYDRAIPTFEQYHTMITQFSEVRKLQSFAQYLEVSDSSQREEGVMTDDLVTDSLDVIGNIEVVEI